MNRRRFLFAVAAAPLAPLAPAPALAQGGIVEATPALFGEIGHEVIFPGKRWDRVYTTEQLLTFCSRMPETIVLDEEGP